MRHPALAALLLTLGSTLAFGAERPFEVQRPDQPVVSSFNIFSLNKVGQASLSGTPSKEAGFVYAFDRRLDTVYTAREPGPVHLNVVFHHPRKLRTIRFLTPEGGHRWTLLTAGTLKELEQSGDGVRRLGSGENRLRTEAWQDVPLPGDAEITALRLVIEPVDATRRVRLTELQLVGEQRLHAIGIKAKSGVIDINGEVPLTLEGYFSGGDTLPITSKALRWVVTPASMARVSSTHQIQGRRRGSLQVVAEIGDMKSPPLPLTVD